VTLFVRPLLDDVFGQTGLMIMHAVDFNITVITSPKETDWNVFDYRKIYR